MPLTRKTLTALSTLTLTALLGAGCGGELTDGDRANDDQPTTGRTGTTESTPQQGSTGQSHSAPSASRSPAGDGTGQPTQSQETRMNIEITIGDQRFGATLRDSRATRDLLAQLPVTLEMSDHGGVEKTGPLPGALSLEGHPEGTDPDVGDIGYFAPGNDLVLYYGDQSSHPGILVLGRMDGDAARHLARLDGAVTATIEAR